MSNTNKKTYTKDEVTLMNLSNDIKYVKETIDKCYKKLDEEYLTKDEITILKKDTDNKIDLLKTEFSLVQKLVYGLIALILTGVISGGLAFLINSPK